MGLIFETMQEIKVHVFRIFKLINGLLENNYFFSFLDATASQKYIIYFILFIG